MKNKLLIILILPLMSFLPGNNSTLQGVWELNQITLNGDTIFYRNHFDYTLTYNFKLNGNWLKNKEDSVSVENQAVKRFENSMSIKMEFLTDSTFSMTKVRSGGRISPNEKDFGKYELKNDTLLMINQSRRDYKMMFIVDFKNGKIFQKDGLPNHMVYQEYLRKNNN